MLAMAPLAANAHMIMAQPKPFGNPDNSPLVPDGSDFPCKAVPYTADTMNDWPVGSSQTLSFTGTAAHGGGSCQISVTTDKAPTKASKWKVIHSIEGGCPTASSGNLEPGDSPSVFQFTVPPELPDGELTMAWTWFNRIGNREMYMNCAPVKVSGGSTDTVGFDELPDMAVANLGTGSCTTTEGSDYTFADPGKSVVQSGSNKLIPLCGGTGYPAPEPPTAYPVAPSPVSASPAPDNYKPAMESTLSTVVTVIGPYSTGIPLPTSAPTYAATPGSACSPHGAVVCSPDGTQYAICNWGKAVFQPVAPGTKCNGGKIAKRWMYSHRNMRTAI